LAKNQYGDTSAAYVPNGVDRDHFSAAPRDKQARPTVGFVYSDAWIKGCDVAVAAVGLAARYLPGLRLVSFASMPLSPALRLPAEAEFILGPTQEKIPRLYARCDAWLWPSRREGFGLPILEAMACRTPVIAAPAGAAPELLEKGGGVLLPSADPVAMADAIAKLVGSSSSEWLKVSEQARAIAARHDWNESVRLFEAALERARA
jgi:glycosyltransferase involved in cell wall biosynthesis